MTIVVAVPDSAEGPVAIAAAVAEAGRLGTDLVAVNLGLTALDPAAIAHDGGVTVIERTGRADRDPADAVLAAIDEVGAERLVIGVRRRSRVSKAVLGSVSQRLILQSPVPVLAVKLD